MVDDRDPVTQLFGFLQIMRGQHYCHARAVEFDHQFPQQPPQFDINPGSRLVEHQHRGRMDHGLGNQQAALHAARKRARIGIALVRQMDLFEQRLGAPQRLGHAIEPGLVLQHLERRKERIEYDFLRHDPDRALGIAAVRIDVKPPDFHAAAGLHHQPGEGVDQGRFARAIGTEQTKDLPLRHVKADIIKRELGGGVPGGGIAFDQVGDADCGGFCHMRALAASAARRKACVNEVATPCG